MTAAALLPVASYALVSIFTPGPNNITASSLGMRVGYARTLRFIAGVVTGFLCVMLASGLLTEVLIAVIARAGPVLRAAGVLYLLWLTYTVLRPERTTHRSTEAGSRFLDGFLLQFVNIKVILFGMTMYATLLVPWTRDWPAILVSALILASLSFCSTSLWALLGAGIQRFVAVPRVKLVYSCVLAALLLYAAWSVAFS